MAPFKILPPAPLRSENGAVIEGNSVLGWMTSRGHRFSASDSEIDCEDSVNVISTPFGIVAGVFDGHGGSASSRSAASSLPPLVAESLNSPSEEKLRGMFAATQHGLMENARGDISGTTATIVAVTPDVIMSGFVGDSQAAVIRDAHDAEYLTGQHRPGEPSEKARIEAKGGTVTEPSGPDDVARLNGLFAVSRALGNAHVEGTLGLCSIPDISTYKRRGDDKLLVIASDGIHDVVPLHLLAKTAMDALARAEKTGEDMSSVALALCKKAYVHRSPDDLSAVVIRLDAGSRPAPAQAIPAIPAALTVPAALTAQGEPPVLVPIPNDPPASTAGSLNSARVSGDACPETLLHHWDMAWHAPSGVSSSAYARRASRQTGDLVAATTATAPNAFAETSDTPPSLLQLEPPADAFAENEGGPAVADPPPPVAALGPGWRLGSALRWGARAAVATAGVVIFATFRRRYRH